MSGPQPWWTDQQQITIHLGDCLDILALLPEASIDAVVTDPPAGVSFMGRDWDSGRGGRDQWIAWLAERMTAAARCLKPGGHALVWALPRTSGWTQLALEDAGLEIRDCIVHIFGQGFPKSRDISKAIDKAAGAEREVVGLCPHSATRRDVRGGGETVCRAGGDLPAEPSRHITAPATADSARWEGWGTALKPGQEIWWLARKPFTGTVEHNVLAHGTGALNIAGCRVGRAAGDRTDYGRNVHLPHANTTASLGTFAEVTPYTPHTAGRWPANLVLTHAPGCTQTGTRTVAGDSRAGQEPGHRPGGFADVGALNGDCTPNGNLHGPEVVPVFDCVPGCPVDELDRQSGHLAGCGGPKRADSGRTSMFGIGAAGGTYERGGGGAGRFFPVFRYQAKAGRSERPRGEDGSGHPTVKPVGLMRWLCRLITPPGGTILDLFAGSGTTGEAAIIEGFNCVLIDSDPESAEHIRTRLRKDIQPDMFGGTG